jgi:hypothetical protein
MKKVIIYYTEDKKSYQIVTPFKQEGRKEEVFDGNWRALVWHITKSHGDVQNYWKYEVI